jgi:hypothetical protein
VPTEEWYSNEARVDVIVLDWGLPKISGIDLLVNSPGLAQFLAAHATLGRNAG